MTKTYLTALLLIIFALSFNLNAQSLFKTNEGIGGSGTTTTSVSESNSNTTLYVIGGALIVGIVVYAVLREKKEKPKDDSTKAVLNTDFLEKQLTLNDDIQKYKSNIPIDILFGIKNDFIKKEEKIYFVGLAYNF